MKLIIAAVAAACAFGCSVAHAQTCTTVEGSGTLYAPYSTTEIEFPTTSVIWSILNGGGFLAFYPPAMFENGFSVAPALNPKGEPTLEVSYPNGGGSGAWITYYTYWKDSNGNPWATAYKSTTCYNFSAN